MFKDMNFVLEVYCQVYCTNELGYRFINKDK